jgi:hypothetical protein
MSGSYFCITFQCTSNSEVAWLANHPGDGSSAGTSPSTPSPPPPLSARRSPPDVSPAGLPPFGPFRWNAGAPSRTLDGDRTREERQNPVSRWLIHAVTVVVALVGSSLAVPAQAREVPGKDQWLADTRAAMYGSRAYVGQRVDQGGGRLAVNFDIDNTSLATYYAKGTAVPVVLRFAKYARAHGVTLLFNTGRKRGQLGGVARSLRRVGYDVKEICGRKAGESLTSSKQRCRKHFVAEGYTIIANVGNRDTDFTGGSYERAFRLPNYGNALG